MLTWEEKIFQAVNSSFVCTEKKKHHYKVFLNFLKLRASSNSLYDKNREKDKAILKSIFGSILKF